MSATHRTWRSVMVAGILAGVVGVGCSTDSDSGGPTLASLAITPAQLALLEGKRQSLTVTGTYQDGTSRTLITDIAFSSVDPSVATVDSYGVVKAVKAGTTDISASKAGLKAKATVTVTAPMLVSISVAPATFTLEKGGSKQLAVKGNKSDDASIDLTTDLTWSSSDTAVAEVSATGVVTAKAISAEAVTLTATYEEPVSHQSFTATASLTVTDKAITGLAISPDKLSLVLGETQQLTATGTFGTETRDVTAGASWDSNTPEVAAVDTTGKVIALTAGSAVIRAIYGGKAAASKITVTVNTSPVVFVEDYGKAVEFQGLDGATNDVTIDPAERHDDHASLEVAIPTAGFTGGTFVSPLTRNLSRYNAVTFWIKGATVGTIDTFGLGHTSSASSPFLAEIHAVPLLTTWTKYAVPIPNPAKLTSIGAFFHFATGAVAEANTMWIADVQFESLTATDLDVGDPAAAIGAQTLSEAVGATVTVAGGTAFFDNCLGRPVTVAPVGNRYFAFTTTDGTVASVDQDGVISALATGSATISAKLNGADAVGAIVLTVAPQ